MGDSIGIVVGDDEVVVLDALSALLTQCGYRVVATAYTQSDLLERTAEVRPELCLLGNGFPDGSGVEAIAAVTRLCPATKVVMLTGQRDAETMRRALDAGAAGYVHRSRGTQVLLDVLHRVVNGEVVVEGSFLPSTPGATAQRPAFVRLAGYLTDREQQCLAMLAEGLDTATMAARLGVSRATVRTHVQAVLSKLGVHSRLEAASVATRYGLVQNPVDRRPRASGASG